ncbi:MAG: hypothetical protein LBM96_04065 [Methanobrevibacter sp.]|nr:hypothetical protein [Candidatus Methanoflexus mossambicus]
MNNLEIDFWMMISTGLMAVATFVSIVVNSYLNKKDREISLKNLEEMKLTRKETNRANIFFYFINKGPKLYWCIKNFGLTEAKNVKISIDPPISNTINTDSNEINVLNEITHTFPPGFEVTSFFKMIKNYNKINDGDYPDYNIKINFTDIYDKNHSLNYVLNLNYLKGIEWITAEHKDINISLSNLDDNIKKICKNLK